jgi:hypothetical protein
MFFNDIPYDGGRPPLKATRQPGVSLFSFLKLDLPFVLSFVALGPRSPLGVPAADFPSKT